MRFDLVDLRLFLSVVEAGRITHGASLAGMSLASASARVRGMEDIIGLPLLERGARGVVATPAGDALAHHARIVLRQIDQLRGELGEYSKGLKGHVRLLAGTAAIAEFLPKALGSYLAANPSVDIELKERHNTEIAKAVAGGFAEIGIISDAVDPGSLELFPFAVDRLVVVVPRESPLAARPKMAFEEVAGHQFVGYTAGSSLQDYLAEHAIGTRHLLSFRVHTNTFHGICSMVEQNVGLGIIPKTAARRYQKLMAIRLIGLTDAWATRHYSLCVRQFDSLSSHARELAGHLTARGTGRR
ncbi:MAG: LysR family transcriptional regulator [Rhodomicrobium sp.]